MLTGVGTRRIETERLVLRRFTYRDDLAMLRHWVADEQVQHLYLEPVYGTREAVKGLLDKYIGGYETPNYYRWAITLKGQDECIGQIAYFLVDEKNHLAEMEYCVGTAFQRRGIVTEAAKAVVRFGFEQIGLHRVQISHLPSNAASRKVMEACGCRYEGTLRDFFCLDGTYVDRCYYSILKSEFEAEA